RFGPRLKTNPKLHAKVYWTLRKMLVTSANASASGFALAGKEDEANIEAGIAITSPEMIKAVKDWFDALYQSPKSARVDKKIIEIAKQKWAIRPPNLPIDGDLSLTEALRDKELIADRNIWVGNFDSGERSPEGLQQHYKLQRDWKTKKEHPPVAIGADIKFTMIEDFEEFNLRRYKWKSWLIDLNDVPAFWYVPDKNRIIKNRNKFHTLTVPVYGTPRISFGTTDGGIRIRNQDMTLLHKIWKIKQGKKNDRWVPLEEFADSPKA